MRGEDIRWWMLGVVFLHTFIFSPVHSRVRLDTAQVHTAQIRLLARSFGDSVVLRWAPTTPGAWRLANRYGYQVWRQELQGDTTVSDTAQLVGAAVLLTPQPLRPWSLAEWKRRFAADSHRATAAVAAQVLYGKQWGLSPRNLQGWLTPLRQAAVALQNRYGFALFVADIDPPVASGLALRFVDHTAERGRTYLYTVAALVPDSLYEILPATTVVRVDSPSPVVPPANLRTEENDGEILLHWDNIGGFTAFWVERSEDGGRSYRRLTTVPLVRVYGEGEEGHHWIYRDTTVRNYVRYRYRVIGITPFGEQSPPAEIDAMGRDRTPPQPPTLLQPMPTIEGWIQVQWEWDDPQAQDLQGFVVYRSADGREGYHPLMSQPLPPTTRQFVDTAATEAEPFYMVAALDTARNAAFSVPYRAVMIDTVPPAPPDTVWGSIDSNGIVRLWWRMGTEPDLLGYRVLWANDTTHEFSQATNTILQDTVFVDTVVLNTLTPFIYYRVAAVDFRRNHSAPSKIIALRRPDTLPPVPPVLREVTAAVAAIQVAWVPSTSRDVAYQLVERRAAGDTSWSVLITLSPNDSLFLDQAAAPDTVYYYRIVAVDQSGNRSVSPLPGFTSLPKRAGADPVVQVRARYDPDSHVVRLQWEYPYVPNQPYWFVVYRGYQHRPLEPYKAVPSTQRTFVDRDLIGSGVYRYAVQVRRQLFGLSPLSTAVMVEVPPLTR